jgi:hypothetical protein
MIPTPEAAVIERLSALAAVTAIVGTRIYQLKAPQQGATPYVRVERISEATEYHTRGVDALRRVRIQIDACAAEGDGVDPLAAAMDLAAAIEGPGDGSALSGYAGALLGSPPTIAILGSYKVNSRHDYEPDELRLARVSDDYLVWWRPI